MRSPRNPGTIQIRVNEFIGPGIVRRVDIDDLDLAEVGLLQYFQHFKVFSFDEDVLRIIEGHRLLSLRAQRGRRRGLEYFVSVGLSCPTERVPLTGVDNGLVAQRALEHRDVELTFRECFGHKRL